MPFISNMSAFGESVTACSDQCRNTTKVLSTAPCNSQECARLAGALHSVGSFLDQLRGRELEDGLAAEIGRVHAVLQSSQGFMWRLANTGPLWCLLTAGSLREESSKLVNELVQLFGSLGPLASSACTSEGMLQALWNVQSQLAACRDLFVEQELVANRLRAVVEQDRQQPMPPRVLHTLMLQQLQALPGVTSRPKEELLEELQGLQLAAQHGWGPVGVTASVTAGQMDGQKDTTPEDTDVLLLKHLFAALQGQTAPAPTQGSSAPVVATAVAAEASSAATAATAVATHGSSAPIAATAVATEASSATAVAAQGSSAPIDATAVAGPDTPAALPKPVFISEACAIAATDMYAPRTTAAMHAPSVPDHTAIGVVLPRDNEAAAAAGKGVFGSSKNMAAGEGTGALHGEAVGVKWSGSSSSVGVKAMQARLRRASHSRVLCCAALVLLLLCVAVAVGVGAGVGVSKSREQQAVDSAGGEKPYGGILDSSPAPYPEPYSESDKGNATAKDSWRGPSIPPLFLPPSPSPEPEFINPPGPPVEFSSSALMFYNGDVVKDPKMGMSPCQLYVSRAAAHKGRRVQLVPTHYWIDKRGDYGQDPHQCYPDNWADTDLAVASYCFKAEWDSKCAPFTKEAIDTFRAGLQQCFATALSLFDEVLIAPHLDPMGDTKQGSKWRNMLRFNPLAKDKGGYSYWDIMLQPTLDAANAAFKDPGKTFHFSMEGEMGGTIITYPAEYLKIIQAIRRGWTSPAILRVGVALPNGYVPGQINRLPGDTRAPKHGGRTSRLVGGMGPMLPFEAWPGLSRIKAVQADLKQLFKEVDFVAVSNYARCGPQPKLADMDVGTANMLQELNAMGVDVRPFRRRGSSKQLIWNEFGLGGGVSVCNNETGTDGTDLALWPYYGISTENYTRAMDPFKKSPEAASYLRSYYKTALQVLSQGGSAQYKVDAAYLWNVVSWDVQGIHTASARWNDSVVQGDWPVVNGYANGQVIADIKAHNIWAAEPSR